MKIWFLEIPTASEYMTFIIVKLPLPFNHNAQRQNRFSKQNGVVKGISQVRSWHWLTYPGFRAPQAIGRPCTTRQLSRSESRPPQPQADNHPPGRVGGEKLLLQRPPAPTRPRASRESSLCVLFVFNILVRGHYKKHLHL